MQSEMKNYQRLEILESGKEEEGVARKKKWEKRGLMKTRQEDVIEY